MNAFWVPIDIAARTACAGRERQATLHIAGLAKPPLGQDCGRQYRFARNGGWDITRRLSTCEEAGLDHLRLPRGNRGTDPAAIRSSNSYAQVAGTARYAL